MFDSPDAADKARFARLPVRLGRQKKPKSDEDRSSARPPDQAAMGDGLPARHGDQQRFVCDTLPYPPVRKRRQGYWPPGPGGRVVKAKLEDWRLYVEASGLEDIAATLMAAGYTATSLTHLRRKRGDRLRARLTWKRAGGEVVRFTLNLPEQDNAPP